MRINIVTKSRFAYEEHCAQPKVQQALKLLGVFDDAQLALAHRAVWCLGWIRSQKILVDK